MAKIGLYDVDGHNFPNLPLMKISAFHKAKGDDVEMLMHFNRYDVVYKSKVFTFSREDNTVIMADEIIEGGTGYGLENKLPSEIERCFPDYSLYPQYASTAYGFLTRGCPNKCPFCIVSKKEGAETRQVAELSEFWSDQRTIKLMDANILAEPRADTMLESLIATGSWIDFTQGLDIRLMDRHRAELLKAMKIKMIHFAWDNPKQDLAKQFEKVKAWMGDMDWRKLRVYVLTNYNSTHEEDLHRIYTLRNLGYDPFVMIYEKNTEPQRTLNLQGWVNNKKIFRVVERFEDYDPKIEGRKSG
jgi:hypothetical protein